MLLLTSCELSELREFILPPEPVVLSLHIEPAETASPDLGLSGVLAQHPHRETMRDALPDNGAPTAEGYASVPFLPGMTVEEAAALLDDAGLAYIIEKKTYPTAAGVVYAVDYAGVGTDGLHYVNPAFPVTLSVSADKPAYPEATAENTIYLTFDDGPDGATSEILDILDCYGIKATFFLLGDSVEKYPEAAQEIYARGHDIACHSMTHQYESIYASADSLAAEVDQWVELMESLGVDFGTTPKLFRYPGGSIGKYFTSTRLAEMNALLSAMGFRIYDWNIVANDALLFQCPEDMSVYDYIEETFASTYQLKKNSSAPKIVLLHETVAETRVVLPRLIEYLIAEGCTFAPLSSLSDSWMFENGE